MHSFGARGKGQSVVFRGQIARRDPAHHLSSSPRRSVDHVLLEDLELSRSYRPRDEKVVFLPRTAQREYVRVFIALRSFPLHVHHLRPLAHVPQADARVGIVGTSYSKLPH